MALEMNEYRIKRWKCPICGDRHKKLSKAYKNKEPVGFSIVCCGCGYVANFACTYDAIPVYAIGMKEGHVDDFTTECGVLPEDLKTCDKRQCPCRPASADKPCPCCKPSPKPIVKKQGNQIIVDLGKGR